ncbi:ABC-type transport auxiliary lipoprotein family protein [Undibacterium sp. RuRC25W]|uniref:ABC-type transport auxiliary lipoprotein family protein n=1 Tax=Undibacterium sp. RuRC25W TaxID=3413047 RepID=UPI003BF04E6C
MKRIDCNHLILASGLLLSGCSLLQPVSPSPQKEYRLEAAPFVSVVRPPTSSMSITLSIIRAASGLDSKNMWYLRRPSQINRYQQSQWQQRPATMLMPLVMNALEVSGLFTVIVQSPNPINTTYQLELELTQLEQDFTVHPSVVHVGLRAYLSENKTHTIVAWQEFRVDQTAPTEDAYGQVVASKLATSELLQRLLVFCRSHVSQDEGAR